MARTSIIGVAILVGVIGAGAPPAGAQARGEVKDGAVTVRGARGGVV